MQKIRDWDCPLGTYVMSYPSSPRSMHSVNLRRSKRKILYKSHEIHVSLYLFCMHQDSFCDDHEIAQSVYLLEIVSLRWKNMVIWIPEYNTFIPKFAWFVMMTYNPGCPFSWWGIFSFLIISRLLVITPVSRGDFRSLHLHRRAWGISLPLKINKNSWWV